VTTMVRSTGMRSALYGGDDVTDLDAFDALDALVESGDLDAGVRVADFVEQQQQNDRNAKLLRLRLEDKGPIKAFHWRDVPDETAAETWLQNVAQEALAEGLEIHWGRKVLEVRPPVPVDKGQAVTTMVKAGGMRSALYGGDDVTDLDAFDALDALIESGDLDTGVRVGVRSSEGPRAIVERADVVVEGVPGFTDVLAALLP